MPLQVENSAAESEAAPSLTRKQYDYIVRAVEASEERKRRKEKVVDNLTSMLAWAALTGIALIVWDWFKFKLTGTTK